MDTRWEIHFERQLYQILWVLRSCLMSTVKICEMMVVLNQLQAEEPRWHQRLGGGINPSAPEIDLDLDQVRACIPVSTLYDVVQFLRVST